METVLQEDREKLKALQRFQPRFTDGQKQELQDVHPWMRLGGVPAAITMGIPALNAIAVCAVGNMLPVPIIYLFARKVLHWGCDKKYIGSFFTYCIEKGERGGKKLQKRAGRGGLFLALMLFVGIPLPGTGAWTGTLAASFLNMGLKATSISVSLGVVIAGIIMGVVSFTGIHVFGL